MFKVFGFLTKRAGMETRDFIDYYEKRHIPLICSLAPTPIVYKRRYLMRDEKLTTGGGEVDFDVMTELVFPDRPAFLAWMARLSVRMALKILSSRPLLGQPGRFTSLLAVAKLVAKARTFAQEFCNRNLQ